MWAWGTKEHCIWVYERIVLKIGCGGGGGRKSVWSLIFSILRKEHKENPVNGDYCFKLCKHPKDGQNKQQLIINHLKSINVNGWNSMSTKWFHHAKPIFWFSNHNAKSKNHKILRLNANTNQIRVLKGEIQWIIFWHGSTFATFLSK